MQGVELKGNLRTEPEEVFAVLQAGLQERYPDMYVVYMMPDAEATDAQSDGRSRVLFQVLPKVVGYPTQGGGWTAFAALLLFFLTVGSMVRCSPTPVVAVVLCEVCKVHSCVYGHCRLSMVRCSVIPEVAVVVSTSKDSCVLCVSGHSWLLMVRCSAITFSCFRWAVL